MIHNVNATLARVRLGTSLAGTRFQLRQFFVAIGILIAASAVCESTLADQPGKLDRTAIQSLISKNRIEFGIELKAAGNQIDEATCKQLIAEYSLAKELVVPAMLRAASRIASDPRVWIDSLPEMRQRSFETRSALKEYLALLYQHSQSKIDALIDLETRLERIIVHCGASVTPHLARINQYDLLQKIGAPARERLGALIRDSKHPDRFVAAVTLKRAFDESAFEGFDAELARKIAGNPKDENRVMALRALVLTGNTEKLVDVVKQGFPVGKNAVYSDEERKTFAHDRYVKLKQQTPGLFPSAHYREFSESCRQYVPHCSKESASAVLNEALEACNRALAALERENIDLELYTGWRADLFTERARVRVSICRLKQTAGGNINSSDIQAAFADLKQAMDACNVVIKRPLTPKALEQKKQYLLQVRAQCHECTGNWKDAIRDWQQVQPMDMRDEDWESLAVCCEKLGDHRQAAGYLHAILNNKIRMHHSILRDAYAVESSGYGSIENLRTYLQLLVESLVKIDSMALRADGAASSTRQSAQLAVDDELIKLRQL